jgi:hypothetical protein
VIDASESPLLDGLPSAFHETAAAAAGDIGGLLSSDSLVATVGTTNATSDRIASDRRRRSNPRTHDRTSNGFDEFGLSV